MGNAYTKITTSENYERYEFVSEGKQQLRKTVTFVLMAEIEQIYNLALYTVLLNGELDCTSTSRNGDMNAVLETVANIAKIVSDQYPQRKIFLAGSDVFRTRQYQIKIAVFYRITNEFFEVEGLILEGFKIRNREKFRSGMNYDGFILTRKKIVEN